MSLLMAKHEDISMTKAFESKLDAILNVINILSIIPFEIEGLVDKFYCNTSF